MVILPVYSLIMMLISIEKDMSWQNILLTFLLLFLGIFIGWLQACGVSIKEIVIKTLIKYSANSYLFR